MTELLSDLAQLGGAVVVALVALWLWAKQTERLVEEMKRQGNSNAELVRTMFTKLDRIIEMLSTRNGGNKP